MALGDVLKSNVFNPRKNIAFILWVVFFCYSVCAALIFQKLLLPLIPSMHAGGGLLSNDAIYFDSVASALADSIRLNGWSSWQLYPAVGAAGNVAILGALYVFFGHDPALVIPVNAAIHALGGMLIYQITREISGKQLIGTYAGVIAATLFVIFPSALNWYAQIHKDGYAIAGMLLIFWTWVKVLNEQYNFHGLLTLTLSQLVGVLLIASVRPYGLKLLIVATLMVCAILVINALLRRQLLQQLKPIMFFLISVIILASTLKILPATDTAKLGESYLNWQDVNGVWRWKKSPLLPDSIEGYVELTAKTRAGMIDYGVREKAKSMIDVDVKPQNIEEVVLFLPRSFHIALLAPFPSSWLSNLSITRIVAAGEMFVYYLCLPGIFLLLYYNRKPVVLAAIFFAAFFLTVHGFTTANLGTLYRLRYAYLFIMLLLGVLGWFTWLDKTGRLNRLLKFLKHDAPLIVAEEVPTSVQKGRRREALGSGAVVMGLTVLTFVGFFVRDVMMARTFGLGVALDSFFIALILPMFFVAVLCMPLGTAFVPVYLNLKERFKPKVATALVSGVSFWTLAGLVIICLILYVAGPLLLTQLGIYGSSLDISQLIPLLEISLLILLFSGVVILGNSVLNANGRAILTSSAQLIVPVAAILALVLFGHNYGVKVVMYGMVVGQLLNLLVVQFYLRQYNVSLSPRLVLANQTEYSPLLLQYFPLVVSAFFVAVAAPVATMLAMSLPNGGVSAFNLGSKVVIFVTGLVSTAMSTVMLPYFSVLVAKNHLISARRELSFFLLLATFISIPVAVAMYVWAEPIVSLMFEGGTFDSQSTMLVTSVMQYAVVQLPFFVCNSLLLKFAIATKHLFAVTVVALVGLVVNIVTSFLLMNHMGVSGIALGGSIAMLFSTLLLVLVLVRYWHIAKFDALIMFLNWLLFVTLLMCIHFKSIPSVYVTLLAYIILLAGYFNSLISDKFSKLGNQIET